VNDQDENRRLTAFQIEVSRLFFSLPASRDFLLAGGAALLAQHLTARPTLDPDFFTRPGGGAVPGARDEFVAAAQERGWTVDIVQDAGSFCRLRVRGPEELIVDIAIDSPPGRPPVMSALGPTFALDELAGRKLVALFDRAAARDFLDVFALSQRFRTSELLDQAQAVDAGFDRRVFADMLDSFARYRDADLAFPDMDVELHAMREFFSNWASELRSADS
jgi:hypothetical protein